MSVEREPEIFQSVIYLCFKVQHIIINSVFFSRDLWLKRFYVSLLVFEELRKPSRVHLYILHHFSQMLWVHSGPVRSITDIRILLVEATGIGVAIPA